MVIACDEGVKCPKCGHTDTEDTWEIPEFPMEWICANCEFEFQVYAERHVTFISEVQSADPEP